MPRVALSAAKAHRKEGSRYANTVTYRNAKGGTVEAKVVGGSGDTLDLRLPHHPPANRELEDIPRRTNLTQTNVWW